MVSSDMYIILVSGLLAINAFFIKGLVTTINDVRLELARLSTQHDNVSVRSVSNQEDIKDLYRIINHIKERVHSLEGGQTQVLSYLENKKP